MYIQVHCSAYRSFSFNLVSVERLQNNSLNQEDKMEEKRKRKIGNENNCGNLRGKMGKENLFLIVL